ncbi:MAG: rod shape-determining protein MreC [Syntrophaceae bacterium CG2_30_49_12]|nr:MAG: rod shape-determining protein MreC [Syntrophaceae bacterium CG2_30_49_12]PIP05693.1 MAG: rod shape-determining protein MreC [Syntrophobacterales bacterium CG23_combo_of_CG06-09_8_20_14_all_48_27]PJA50709.1 MAG: rod shape-determining protein MreC [Syntrophobacterales bacterium CG_4_9_14_3_um_filter_49_8]PJC75749.1 MAG: rod shape-determining protein MreC [Syntrophobacterales bacterium CG_4_8_14_3_um_filter_49_14]
MKSKPKKYQLIIIVFTLIIVLLSLTFHSVKRSSETGIFKKLVLEIAAPLMDVINTSFEELTKGWKRYIFLVGLEEENRQLKKKNILLTGQLIQYQEGYLEGIRLQKLLKLKENLNYSTITAMVVGRNKLSGFQTILINKGTAHNLRIGLPVAADQGVIGRITEASWHVSKILLLTDENSKIDALVQRTRTPGILHGSGFISHLKYVPKTDDVRVGDAVISSGMGGVFPKGLLLGFVKSVDKRDAALFQKVEVTPSVDVARIEEVLVFLPDNDDKK